MADVSIIIPTFNRLWCLPRAIQSCRGTKCSTEIIVVDDGSSDGTWDWLQSQTDVLSFHQENQGQTWAINLGFSNSKGKYIRFLDSDDFLCPGYIDLQFEAAVKTGTDLVYSRVDNYSQKSGVVIPCPDLELWDDFLAVQLGTEYGSHFLGMLFKRHLVEQVPRRPDFAQREDRMFLLEIGLLHPRITFVRGVAGYWVQHESQMQANYCGMKSVATNWQHLNIYRRILALLEARGELTIRRKTESASALWVLAHWIARTHLDEACEVADWVFELDSAFQIPEQGLFGYLYRRLGFRKTQLILKARRSILLAFKRKHHETNQK